MAKRATERYTTARDMAEDLQLFLKSRRPIAGVAAAPPHRPSTRIDRGGDPDPHRSGRSDSEP